MTVLDAAPRPRSASVPTRTWGICAVGSPVVAVVVLVIASFFRLALAGRFPVDPVLAAAVLVVLATVLWMDRIAVRLRGLGAVEWALLAYLTWNVYSMFAAHKYPAGPQLPNTYGIVADFSVPRFIVMSIVVPLVVYTAGRYAFDRESAVRLLLWLLVGIAAYSAAVSILQFTGPTSWVWPRYIVDAPNWDGRAVGVFNQPVINGMVLVLGFGVAMVLAGRRSEPRWQRYLAVLVAVACGYAVFLTHTRAVWLAAAMVLVTGALLATGFRTGFVAALSVAIVAIFVNWSVFSGSDRSAGGVGSVGELEDRLNSMKTALWAAAEKPFAGWGIGRFPAVNTYHHQQWSLDTPWVRGYGIVSHDNELGILAELGVVGLALWLGVLILMARRLRHAYQTLPAHELCGRPLALVAIMAALTLVVVGRTVDLRFFDFAMVVVFLLAGVSAGYADRQSIVPQAAIDPGGLSEPSHHG